MGLAHEGANRLPQLLALLRQIDVWQSRGYKGAARDEFPGSRGPSTRRTPS
jgi:hypothetical protein